MGSSLQMLLCAALALSTLAALVAQEELDNGEAMFYERAKLSAQGHVFCDRCGQGLQSNETVPLQDVEVSVRCRDLYGFVTFSGIGWTNEQGAFSIPMDNLPSVSGLAGCKAKLVRSMNEQCNTITNIHGGQVGAPLLLNFKSFELVVFTTGPFAFSPASHLPACQGSSDSSHTPSVHYNVGTPNYPSPPPPPPVNRATYFYISPPPPPPHSSPLHSPPPPPPPLLPSPSPPTPPPSPFYWYKSPSPTSVVTHSPPYKAPTTSPVSYAHRYRYHHYHRSPLPPAYDHSSPHSPPLHPPFLPPYHYTSPPFTKGLPHPQLPPPPY